MGAMMMRNAIYDEVLRYYPQMLVNLVLLHGKSN
jgi:hypothetical protein